MHRQNISDRPRSPWYWSLAHVLTTAHPSLAEHPTPDERMCNKERGFLSDGRYTLPSKNQMAISKA
jgi:hypothetical protein